MRRVIVQNRLSVIHVADRGIFLLSVPRQGEVVVLVIHGRGDDSLVEIGMMTVVEEGIEIAVGIVTVVPIIVGSGVVIVMLAEMVIPEIGIQMVVGISDLGSFQESVFQVEIGILGLGIMVIGVVRFPEILGLTHRVGVTRLERFGILLGMVHKAETERIRVVNRLLLKFKLGQIHLILV